MQQLTALVFVLSVVPALVNAQTVSEIIARYNSSSTTYQGLTIPYRYYVPKNYSPSNKYAIITFLHGAGERGIDNVKQLVRTPIILANDTVQSLYKFFIVAPQVILLLYS
jgi:predicted peptidase